VGYKKMKQNLGFADLALSSSIKHNRSLKLMETLDAPPFLNLCLKRLIELHYMVL